MSGLTDAEWKAIDDASWVGAGRSVVERIVAAREAAAAEQARAEVVAPILEVAGELERRALRFETDFEGPRAESRARGYRTAAREIRAALATAPRTPLQRANAAADELGRAVGEMGES